MSRLKILVILSLLIISLTSVYAQTLKLYEGFDDKQLNQRGWVNGTGSYLNAWRVISGGLWGLESGSNMLIYNPTLTTNTSFAKPIKIDVATYINQSNSLNYVWAGLTNGDTAAAPLSKFLYVLMSENPLGNNSYNIRFGADGVNCVVDNQNFLPISSNNTNVLKKIILYNITINSTHISVYNNVSASTYSSLYTCPNISLFNLTLSSREPNSYMDSVSFYTNDSAPRATTRPIQLDNFNYPSGYVFSFYGWTQIPAGASFGGNVVIQGGLLSTKTVSSQPAGLYRNLTSSIFLTQTPLWNNTWEMKAIARVNTTNALNYFGIGIASDLPTFSNAFLAYFLEDYGTNGSYKMDLQAGGICKFNGSATLTKNNTGEQANVFYEYKIVNNPLNTIRVYRNGTEIIMAVLNCSGTAAQTSGLSSFFIYPRSDYVAVDYVDFTLVDYSTGLTFNTTITPSTNVYANTTLTCNYTFSDNTTGFANSSMYNVTWFRNTTAILYNNLTLAGSYVTRFNNYICQINGTTNTSIAVIANSSSVNIINYPPNITQSNITPSIAYKNNTLVGSCTIYDIDNDTITLNYTWFRNNTNISSGGLQINNTNVISTYYPNNISALNKNNTFVFLCTANDGYNISVLNSSSVKISNSIPIANASIIPPSGYTYNNFSLFCNSTDIDNDNIIYNWSVYLNTTLNSSGTTGSYIQGQAVNVQNLSNLGGNTTINLTCQAVDTDNASSYSTYLTTIQIGVPLMSVVNIQPNIIYNNQTNLLGYCQAQAPTSNVTYNTIWYNFNRNTTTTKICYQETANVSTACGGYNNGSYSFPGIESAFTEYMYINYSKPAFALNAIWQIKNNATQIFNVSIPSSCWNSNNNILQLRVLVELVTGVLGKNSQQCYNGVSWEYIGFNATGPLIVVGVGQTPVSLIDGDYSTGMGTDGAQWRDWGSGMWFYEEAIFWNYTYIGPIFSESYNLGPYSQNTLVNVNNVTQLQGNWSIGDNITLSCQAMDSNSQTSNLLNNSKRVYGFPIYNETNFVDSSTIGFPQIGDIIQLNGSISNDDIINTCKLWINDNGTYYIPSTGISSLTLNNIPGINYVLPFTFIVRPISRSNNSNITWYIQCNDTTTTLYNSTIHWFNVSDVTAPVVTPTQSGTNFNLATNKTVFSRDFYNATYNITFFDYNLFAAEILVNCEKDGNIYNWTVTNFNGTTNYTKTDTINLNGKSMQKCTFFTASSDSHTDEEIPDYGTETLDNGLSYLTENNNIVQIISQEPTVNINDINTQKQIDRYTFEFNFNDKKNERKFRIVSPNKIYYLEYSRYPAHFVIWNEETHAGNWLDFRDKLNLADTYAVQKINDYEYEVTITSLQSTDTSQFLSIGGTLITNFTAEFYIGGSIYTTGVNTYDNTTISGYNYNLGTIYSYPGINISGNVPVTNLIIQNVSNGTYWYNLSHSQYFPQIRMITMINDSLYYNYTTTQSFANIYFRNIASGLSVINISYNLTNVNTGKQTIGNTDNLSYIFIGLNASNYTLSWSKTSYINSSYNFSITYLENKTIYIDMPFYATFHLYDEKTLGAFNMSGPSRMVFQLYCPTETVSTLLNSSMVNFTIPITCDYDLFRFQLDYGATSYYRTFILNPDEAQDVNIYLIDTLTTQSVYNSLVADDLLKKYVNPKIYVLKIIGNETVQITASPTDIEQKIGAYLIENNQYIVEIHSDNFPVYSIGIYSADSSGTKNIRLYNVGVFDDSAVNATGPIYYMSISNTTGDQIAFAKYRDDDNLTTTVTFNLYDESSPFPIYTASSTAQDVIFYYNVTPYYNVSSIYGEILATRTSTIQPSIQYKDIIHEVSQISMGIFDYVSRDTVNWFLIILLGMLAIMGTIQTANYVSIAMIGLAALFVAFGWLTISAGVLALAGLISLIALLKEGERLS